VLTGGILESNVSRKTKAPSSDCPGLSRIPLFLRGVSSRKIIFYSAPDYKPYPAAGGAMVASDGTPGTLNPSGDSLNPVAAPYGDHML